MKVLKEVTVEVTQRCNAACIFCSLPGTHSCKNEISLNRLLEIATFCAGKGAQSITVTGGEPLLHDDIPLFIGHIKALGLKTILLTSGTVQSIDPLEKIAGRSSRESITFVFNYPSADKAVFQRLINSTAFEPLLVDSYIRFLVSHGFEVEAHIVPNALNIDTLYSTAVHLKKIGVRMIRLPRMALQGRAEKNGKALLKFNTLEKLSRVIVKATQDLCDSDFDLRIGVPMNTPAGRNCHCMAGFNTLLFKANGSVFPSEATQALRNASEFILGNIDTDTLSEIWNNHPVHMKIPMLRQKFSAMDTSCPARS